jgi:hypothetical protein
MYAVPSMCMSVCYQHNMMLCVTAFSGTRVYIIAHMHAPISLALPG